MSATWLVKSEPSSYSIDDLAAEPRARAIWDGVRNYQARNFMREMKQGDRILFYHSSCKTPAIVGLAEVVREAFPDPTQFDPNEKYYDPKSPSDAPRWDAVEIALVRKLEAPVSLTDLREIPELSEMALLRRGNRLSVTPVLSPEWKAISKRLA